MGINGNDNHNHHHHQSCINDQKSLFLPILCRLSIKDVKLNTVPIAAVEPSSPKVSCIGQVKRNNRVVGYPATTAAAAANHHKHSKPKKLLFSTKTLLPNPAAVSSAAAAGRSCRTNRETRVNNTRRSRMIMRTYSDHDQDCGKVAAVDVGEMDPPLPVVKRAAPPEEVSLWKRRLNGVQSLQIEPIHLPNNRFQQCD